VNWLTTSFEWLEQRLDKGGWVRRTYLVVSTVLTWKVVIWSMAFVEASKLGGADIAMIVGAVGVPIAAVQKFAFDAYLESRKE
jgi:hypothetical protein